jgi:hypothetical protein
MIESIFKLNINFLVELEIEFINRIVKEKVIKIIGF